MKNRVKLLRLFYSKFLNFWFSDVFRGHRNGTFARNGLKMQEKLSLFFSRHFAKLQKVLWRNTPFKTFSWTYPTNIYLLKVHNRNTRKKCSKLTIKTPERRQSRRSGVFVVNFEHISHLFLMFLL